MKLVRYGRLGAEKPGVIGADGKLRALASVIDDITPEALAPASLKRLKKVDVARLPAVSGHPRLGCPLAGIGKMVCIGLNYTDHAAEVGLALPKEPTFFIKANSAICGPDDPTVRPRDGVKLDYEVELAAVIGREARYVDEADALAHVAGYTCANDIGMHDFRHADRGSMLRVKGQDGFLPLGPGLVPAADFDPTDFALRTILNGEVVQEATADDLIWGVAYQLADLCRTITLEPGDVVLTGTPSNSRPMEAGDVVEVEIDGIGRLTNEIVEWDVDLAGPGEQLEVSANTLHVALAISELMSSRGNRFTSSSRRSRSELSDVR
jgi:5-oxopent-3-ene-1,2,5-tricarboxylate decarboxylase/2-hydroxyhepta-2,4-diene-1,7-dioate isomerase